MLPIECVGEGHADFALGQDMTAAQVMFYPDSAVMQDRQRTLLTTLSDRGELAPSLQVLTRTSFGQFRLDLRYFRA